MRCVLNPKFCFFVLYCVLVCVLLADSPVLGRQSGNDDPQTKFEVYRLVYTPVEEAKAIIENLIAGRHSMRISIESRTNSVIVSGTEADHGLIGPLIKQIDVQKREPVNARPPEDIKMIPFSGLSPSVVHDVLQAALSDRKHVRMEVLDEMGFVVLYGDVESIELARSAIQTIRDAEQPTKKTRSVYVSMTFVIDGGQLDQQLTKGFGAPSPKIGAVIKQAMDSELISIGKPLVVSKTVNRVRVEHEVSVQQQIQANIAPTFENRSESSGQAFSMRNTGYIAQLNENAFQVSASIALAVMTSQSERIQGMTELNADLEVPLNHPVMLSFSTILGVDSAVIVELHEAQ